MERHSHMAYPRCAPYREVHAGILTAVVPDGHITIAEVAAVPAGA